MAKSTHRCFSRQTLVDFHLGKLSQDRITEICAESSACPACSQLLATLDGVADSMLSVLQGLGDVNPISGDAVKPEEMMDGPVDQPGGVTNR